MLPNKMFFDNFIENFDNQSMSSDIYEQDENYIIEIEVPGFTKENMEIELNDGILKVSAFKNEESENRKYLHRERKCFSKCERTFNLGNVDSDNIKAEFKNGILKITISKLEEEKAVRKVNID